MFKKFTRKTISLVLMLVIFLTLSSVVFAADSKTIAEFVPKITIEVPNSNGFIISFTNVWSEVPFTTGMGDRYIFVVDSSSTVSFNRSLNMMTEYNDENLEDREWDYKSGEVLKFTDIASYKIYDNGLEATPLNSDIGAFVIYIRNIETMPISYQDIQTMGDTLYSIWDFEKSSANVAFTTANIAAVVNDYYKKTSDENTAPKYVVQRDLNKDGINEYIVAVEKYGAEYGILIYQQNNTIKTYEFNNYSGWFFTSSKGYLCREYDDGVCINLYIWEFMPDKITEHFLFANNEIDANGDDTGKLTNCKYNDATKTEKEFWDIAGQFGVYNDGKAENYLSKMPNVINNFITPATATPTTSKILVNGAEKSFEAYNIDGNNYFKLRDLAFILSGTGKQFEVTWDETKNAINLISGKPYTAVGGEMKGTAIEKKKATMTMSKIYKDGGNVNLKAYNIDGNNFFKLRDVMMKFDVFVGWDGATSTITLDTSKSYEWE